MAVATLISKVFGLVRQVAISFRYAVRLIAAAFGVGPFHSAIELSNSEQISRQELKTSLDLSSTDLINGLESLQKRYLVKKIKGDKILFKLDSVFRESLKNCGKNSC